MSRIKISIKEDLFAWGGEFKRKEEAFSFWPIYADEGH